MLVLSRKANESIVVRNDITVTVVQIHGNRVKIGIDAPDDVPVHRHEVADAIAENDDHRGYEFEQFDVNHRRLLVVSNDRRTRSVLKNVLGDRGGDVDVANTSACALEYADEKEYDVAIIDESLEKTRGQELFEQIKGCQTAVKGILCSEQPTIETVEAAVDSGMESVAQKPIDQSEILELVSN